MTFARVGECAGKFLDVGLVVLAEVGEVARVGRRVEVVPGDLPRGLAAHEVVADAARRLQHPALEGDGGAVAAEPGLADAQAGELGHGPVLAAVNFDEEDGHAGGVNHLARDEFAGVDVGRGAGGRVKFFLDQLHRFHLAALHVEGVGTGGERGER